MTGFEKSPQYTEDAISQLPALHLMQNLGWQYLTQAEALDLRTGSHQTRRPDIVLFVNGIPFCVIKFKDRLFL